MSNNVPAIHGPSLFMSTDLGNIAWPSTWSYQVSECVPAIHGPNSCTKKSLNLHIMYQQFIVHHMQVTRFLATGVWAVNYWHTFVHLLFFHEKSLRGENAKRLNKLMYKNWFLICVILLFFKKFICPYSQHMKHAKVSSCLNKTLSKALGNDLVISSKELCYS